MATVERGDELFEVEERLPMLPLRDVVIFPHMTIPLLIGRATSVGAIEEAAGADRSIFVIAQRRPEVAEPDREDLHDVGTVARVLQLFRLPDGALRVLVEGLVRARLRRLSHRGHLPGPPRTHFRAHRLLAGDGGADAERALLLQRVRAPLAEDPGRGAHRRQQHRRSHRLELHGGFHLLVKVSAKQEILEVEDVKERLELLGRILASEREILELERKIEGQVRNQLHKNQKEFYLNEQLKAIRKELGFANEFSSEIEELSRQIKRSHMPKEVRERAEKELDRLGKMSFMSPEATVVRNYVDWLVSLPWKARTKDNLDLAAVDKVLNEDHYGLEKIKERIVEHLAVLKLSGNLKGPILCFVGPPGVGKTSLGQSIARAMGRKFVRMSLGGVRDEAEIRGHRRTYVGSMPGRIIQAMKRASTRNPVLLLDEIDKLGADYRGDPAAALLEVLDPEQHHAFNDHYLEVDFDLSEVMFITTANNLFTIPPALLDRMEVIRLPGYLEHEKVEIAHRFLLPKQMKANGLQDQDLVVTGDALRRIIRDYTRESGVRNLEREIATICRKAARKKAAGEDAEVEKVVAHAQASRGAKGRKPAAAAPRPDLEALAAGLIEVPPPPPDPPLRITATNLPRFLGVPRFVTSDIERENRIGIATGLAWTEVGGEVLTVEVTVVPGKGELKLTGKLGEVMRESAQAALSYARARAQLLGIDRDFYKEIDLHVHLPEGAIPKDGPSAGITIAVAMISALTGIATRDDLAMTGEITLRGRVLPIGGLAEKIVAARRHGLKRILIPKGNEKDLVEIHKEARRGLEIIPVSTMDEVLERSMMKPVLKAASAAEGEAAAPAELPPGVDKPKPAAGDIYAH